MRIEIRHEITYTCERPTQPWLHVLRVTPWSFEGQHLEGWRIDGDCDCRLKSGDDAFGNVVDTVGTDQPMKRVALVAQGEIVTADNAGVLRGAPERFPPALFLRDTEATAADDALRAFAEDAAAAAEAPLDRAHALMGALHGHMRFDPARPPAPKPAEAFGAGAGTARDVAHLFIAASRHLGLPARFVSGCLAREDGEDASHFWAEAHVPGIGWIGFDPVHRQCPDERYVRIAMALDHAGAAPLRGQNPHNGERTVALLRAREARPAARRSERSMDLEQTQIQRMIAPR